MTIDRIRGVVSTYRKIRIDPQGMIPSAVLFPIADINGRLHVLLLQRSDRVDKHKGEVSFPGGQIDPSDRGPLQAALREANEEVGILPQKVEIIGELDDYITVTGFHITPFLGLLSDFHDLTPRTVESTEAFFVPLDFFAQPQNVTRQYIEWQGQKKAVYVSNYQEKIIWGATLAMIIRFFKVINDENR